ncbi:MAG: class II aldolase/adducin family protein [Candidatus Methanomethylophilaceae archaeon]
MAPDLTEGLVDVCTRLYQRRLTFSTGGNISVRDGDRVYITPSGRNKGMLKRGDIVTVDMDGRALQGGKPSIETGFHLAIYKMRPEVQAVVHCHPQYCTALAVMGAPMRTGLTPEGVLLLGDVPLVPYGTPGTQDLVRLLASYCVDHDALLMARHGALTMGKDLEEAFNRMEELEFQAHMQFLVGDAEEIPLEERRRILGLP